jgi:hypothetical protein
MDTLGIILLAAGALLLGFGTFGIKEKKKTQARG